MQCLPARVVLAALEHGDANVATERPRGDRDVLREQLLLERLRRGRDDDALPRLERRQQVREALAGSRPGLREQVPPRVEGALDGRRERRLLGPRLEARQHAREPAVRSEDRVHPRGVYAGERMFVKGPTRAGPFTSTSQPVQLPRPVTRS